MERYLELKYIAPILGIIIFCFVPLVDMEYQVIVEKQFIEKIQEPYQDVYEQYDWPKNQAYPTIRRIPITRFRTVTKEVTRPVVETRTKRVSIFRYLLR